MTAAAVCYAKSSRGAALAWTTLAFFAGFAGVSAFGPIVAKIKQSMQLSPLMMGLLAASPALTGSLLRIPFGALVDRLGGKRPILILLGLAALGVAGITAVFSLAAAPRSSHYPFFLIFGVLCGCGIAVFSVGIPTVSYWYPQRSQGTALAIYAGLGNLAPGIFALALPLLVETIGFKFSYVAWFLLLAALSTTFALFMRDAPYFQYKEMGIELNKDALLFACGEELFPAGTAATSLRRAASDWRTWVLTGFYFVSFGGFIALTVWLPTYWAEYFGMSLVAAGGLTSLYSLGASLLRVVGGVSADRIGGERTLLLSFSLVAGAGAVMATSSSLAVAVAAELALALGMGFANAAVFKLVPAYTPETVGGAAGIVGGLGAFGGFVIPPLLGWFVAVFGSRGYAYGFSIFSLLALASLGLVALLSGGARRGS